MRALQCVGASASKLFVMDQYQITGYNVQAKRTYHRSLIQISTIATNTITHSFLISSSVSSSEASPLERALRRPCKIFSADSYEARASRGVRAVWAR